MVCCFLIFRLPALTTSHIGTVQLATLHEWVQAIFPEVPPRLDEGVLDQTYLFRNSYTGATTTAEFRQNEVSVCVYVRACLRAW